MKHFLIIAVLLFSASSQAFITIRDRRGEQGQPNNPTRTWGVFWTYYMNHGIPQNIPDSCPKKFCREPDDGLSWTKFCSNLEAPRHSNALPSGVTRYNGTTCLCHCVGSKYDRHEYPDDDEN